MNILFLSKYIIFLIIFFSEDVLRSTVHKCQESFNGSELYIVGTMNSSNVLANRTRRLIDDIKPDVVFVQSNEQWWKGAQLLEYVKSQEEMDKANEELSKVTGVPKSFKGLLGLRFQAFNAAFKSVLGLPICYNPYLPGLEMKYACEEAQKCGSKIVFLGSEFDDWTLNAIRHEKRFTLLKFILRIFRLKASYQNEGGELKIRITERGINNFIESSYDSKNNNWFYAFMELVAPEYKRILVDKKDEELFKAIIANKGKKMVAVVNQHHMEGLEHHWCSAYGTIPTYNNDNALKKINPIGDMPLRRMLYDQMNHIIFREVKTSRMKASPASLTNEINVYHREFNHQFEHRNL